MKLLIILSCVILTNAGVSRHTACNGPVINEVIHTEEILATGLDRPYLLSTDYTTNAVYFSYSVYADDSAYKSAKIDLNTKELTYINDVKEGFAQCASENGDVYIGGSDGVYKYDKVNNTAELYIAKGVSVWTVFCKDVLYYTDNANVYTVVDGMARKLKEIKGSEVRYFAIDNDGNIFYANARGLFRQRKGSRNVVYYADSNDMSIRGVAIDLNGDVYLAANDGIYAVSKVTNDLKIHLKANEVYGVTFDDKNNIVYADDFSIYKLRPTRYEECI